MQKQYHELVPHFIFMGGADDIQAMVDAEGIQMVVDLREESLVCASHNEDVIWKKVPFADHAPQAQSELLSEAIETIVAAYQDGIKVAFHCGGGKGRTGMVAAGVLLELGLCSSIDEAEAKAKSIRHVISIKPQQREALEILYPSE